MDSSQDFKMKQDQAAWYACLALRDMAASKGSITIEAFGNAMFNAGTATAFFEARDLVETLEAKLRDAKAMKK